ncbi:MAG: FAD-binding oxidoreductase [Rubellimicrobium sp.]|nr:FAD-binding oxidoreductase [Rubellimicrobium sp.]
MTVFPFSVHSLSEHRGPLPTEADVVVVGGGIIGLMTAWHLAKAGLRAVVVEKGKVGGEQSSRNWGWIRQQGRDPAELPIMIEANAIWRGLGRRIGPALGLARTGVLYLAETEKEVAGFEDWLVHARAHDVDTVLCDGAAVAGMMPQAGRRWLAGLWTASDMRAEPWVAVPLLARMAVEDGVTIREHCAARLIDMAGGKVAGVVTEHGRIAAPEVVVAGGAWSSLFLRRHGVSIPQLSVKATVLATGPLPEVFAGQAADGRLAWRRRADGGYSLAPGAFHEFFIGPDAVRNFGKYIPQLRADYSSTHLRLAAPPLYPDAWGTARSWSGDAPTPFERMRILNPAPNARVLGQLVADFAETFPGLPPVTVARAWAGMIDTMPDTVPVIDRARTPEGLTIATGMSGHGFGIGPGIGRVVADMVRNADIGHDLTRFRLSRFTDGSPLVPGPSL